MRKLSPEPKKPLFEIRSMTAADLPAVLEIERGAFRHPWSTELIQRELTQCWSTILLAEEATDDGEKELLGVSIFWIVHNELHLLNVATAPSHRRRGVARALITETLERARRKACTLATLEVRHNNHAARRLYESLGFRAVGIRPNYYADEGEDAVVMVLDL